MHSLNHHKASPSSSGAVFAFTAAGGTALGKGEQRGPEAHPGQSLWGRRKS